MEVLVGMHGLVLIIIKGGSMTLLEKLNDTFYSKSVFTFDMPVKRSIDIDYDYQFFMAETIFKKFK